MTPTFKQISDLLAKRILGLIGAFESNKDVNKEFYVGKFEEEPDTECQIWLSSVESSYYEIVLNFLLADLEDEFILIITDSNSDNFIGISYDEFGGEWYENAGKVWSKSNLEFIYATCSLIEGINSKNRLWSKFVGDERVMKNYLKDFLEFTSKA
jgi:hypothetical protein